MSNPGKPIAFVFFSLFSLAYSTNSWCAECTPSFPYAQQWLGGDAAYSIPLDAQHSIWLFGDTFVGDRTKSTRRDSQLVANSIAISTCRDGAFHIDYYLGTKKSGTPRPFFDSATRAYRYWPMDGFVYDGILYVALSQVATRPQGGGPFDFEMRGVKLARIVNPGDDPRYWSIAYVELASDEVVFPGVAAVLSPPWVYLFAVLANGAHPNHPLILTRLALDQLDRPAWAIEHLATDGTWKRGLNWRDARVVIDYGHTEMSIRYHRDIRKWIVVQQKPGVGAGAGIRTADHLEGPWSRFQNWFSMPETPPTADGTFCYAAKEHVEFSQDSGDFLITYVCNSRDFAKLVTDPSLYRPQVIRVPGKP
jgi:hypothetical protein